MTQFARSHTEAADVVARYLAAMEARDLSLAKSFLADEFEMIFPGGVRFRQLEDLVEWARTRYRFVKKSYERFDVSPLANGDAAVTCFGTLSGQALDGTAFSGIRFCDWFLLSGGKLVRQEVWNDLAEVRGRQH